MSLADDVCVDLAAENAELIERVVALETDVRIYRELGQQAIHALHDVTRDRDRYREQHRRLLDEFRRLREQTMQRVAA